MSRPVGRRVEARQARRGDDGKRAAVSFEPEPERDEGGARRYTYVQDRSSNLKTETRDFRKCDITTGRQPGIAIANIHKANGTGMQAVCAGCWMLVVRGARLVCMWASRVMKRP